jgi:hypothetical protein
MTIQKYFVMIGRTGSKKDAMKNLQNYQHKDKNPPWNLKDCLKSQPKAG